MPVSYDIDVPRAVVRTRFSGVLMVEEIAARYHRLSRDPRFDRRFQELIDLLEMVNVLGDVQVIRRLVRQPIFAHRTRHAVVARSELQTALAITIQTTAQPFGRQVDVFRKRADAERWLRR